MKKATVFFLFLWHRFGQVFHDRFLIFQDAFVFILFGSIYDMVVVVWGSHN